MRKPRILQMVASSQGGAAVHMFDIAKGIDRQRFGLTVIMPGHTGDVDASELERRGIRVVPFNVFNRFSLKEFLNLSRFIRKGNFDVVHFHGTRVALFGRLASVLSLTRPKIVYTIHGFHAIHYRNPFKKAFVLLLERLLGLVTDMIVCVSHSDRESVIKTKVATTDRVKTIWNGIDIKRFRNVRFDRSAKRSELGIPRNAFLLTMIGRLHLPKDFFTLIAAFQLLQHQLPDARLLIVGNGPLREELEHYAKKQQVDNKVVFTGPRRDIPEILAITDIFVLSTRWEGLPLVLLEAMASAKPVIASDVDGNREVVTDGETGILVPPAEPDSLARAIIGLARNPQRAREMGEKGLARVKDNFTLEEMIRNTTKLYEALIE